ncbi:MAG TPA: class I adenylate-forming enzyme family protein [Xanthobacteraceae bacterium]|nr:class I adenylate-forming enzyme family protein [Xanthobacteraceae bacterium]
MNILDPIFFQCKINPLTTAICVPGSAAGSVTYGRLERLIHNVSRQALNSGIAPGSLVGLFVTDTILHAALILGLMRLGLATVSLRSADPVAGMAPDVVLTDVPGRFGGQATVLSVDATWLDGDGTPLGDNELFHPKGSDIGRIVLTSGSTGFPKGIAFSFDTWMNRIAYYPHTRGLRFACCARFFCDLGVGTAVGFMYLMSLLSRGGTIYFLGPKPGDILQYFDLHKIQGMATSPYGLGEFLKYFEADSAFEVSLDHIICQGAILSRELSRRARARLCQNLYCTYGTTETAGVAFGPANIIEAIPGAVGYVQPGATVEIVDKSGQILPLGHDGLLRIRSIHAASEYVGDPETSRLFFRDGCFYPGDLGQLGKDGLLIISGREKTALLIGSDTVAPETIEAILTSYPGVVEAGCFAKNNSLGIAEICALIVSPAPVNENALRQHCAMRLQDAFVPTCFVAVDELPRGANGKIERHRLPALAAAKLMAN